MNYILFRDILEEYETMENAVSKLTKFFYNRIEKIYKNQGLEIPFTYNDEEKIMLYVIKFAIIEKNGDYVVYKFLIETVINKCYRVQYPVVEHKIVYLNDKTPNDIISNVQHIFEFLSAFGSYDKFYPPLLDENIKLSNCGYGITVASINEPKQIVNLWIKDKKGNIHKIPVNLKKGKETINFEFKYGSNGKWVNKIGDLFTADYLDLVVNYYCGK
ncbi:MAG: hypothetical protein QW478_01790 [Candidatus Micrarchaeaceae archaeon]